MVPVNSKYENNENQLNEVRLQRKKKLSIVGFAPTYVKTDFNDPDMEIWIINGLYRLIDQIENVHYERLYDLHRKQYIIEQNDDGHVERLQELAKQGIQIWSCEPLDFLPESNVLPLDEIEKIVNRSYWTNTISYLIAHAIYEKKTGTWSNLEEIHILGVDMAQSGEFAHQRPSCEWIIGWAEGFGIKVIIPQESDLLRSAYKYGFDVCPVETKVFIDKLKQYEKQIEQYQGERNKLIAWRNTNVQKIENEFNQKINQIDAIINQLRGASDVCEYFQRLIFAQNNGVPFNPTLTEQDKEIFKKK